MAQDNTLSLSEPALSEGEKQALCAVIDSGWLTMGERVTAFERAFAALHGVEHAVAVNSCTAGLHLCLAALNIRPGDEVLVPSLTFVATVNAVLYVRAKPVFVDIERNDRPHLSLADAEDKCTPRTRAVIIMHYGGYLMDLPAWRSFADRHRLALIEDAAHAPAVGEVGQWGDAAAFSFFTNKNMTTAEGGMVLARDSIVLRRVRRMRAHGMSTGTFDRYCGRAYTYDVTVLGYNYRLDELRAAMGLVQLARLPQWNTQRQALVHFYRTILAERIPDVVIPFGSEHQTAAHLMPILLPRHLNRERIMTALRKAGIQTSIHYPSVHRFSYYRERFPETALPRTEEFATRVLSLPLHPQLCEIDVSRIVATLCDALPEASHEPKLQANY